MVRSISILQSRQMARGRIHAPINLPGIKCSQKTSRRVNMCRGPHPSALRRVISWMLFSLMRTRSQGRAASVGADLCSLGLCREHTPICVRRRPRARVSGEAAARLASWRQHQFRQTIGSQQGREHVLLDSAIIKLLKSNENGIQFFWHSDIFFHVCGPIMCLFVNIKWEISLTAPAENGLVSLSVNVY